MDPLGQQQTLEETKKGQPHDSDLSHNKRAELCDFICMLKLN